MPDNLYIKQLVKKIIKEGSKVIVESKFTNNSEFTLVDIRTATNTFSSTDKKLYKLSNEVNSLKRKYGDLVISRDSNVEIEGKMYKVHNVTLAPKLTLRGDNDLAKEQKEQINNELLKIGFREGYPEEYNDYLSSQDLKRKIGYEKEREDQGYVLTKYDSKNQSPKDYIGGFDLEIIFKEALISYIQKGLVFGYIGHSARKIWVDKLLAKIVLPHVKPDAFANWLTSTAGRHFGDRIYDMVEKEDRKGVEFFIKRELPKIHDQSVIFNSPEHKGNLGSSKELFKKYKNLGMMMGNEYS